MYKILVRDNMSPLAKERLEAFGNIQVVVDNDKKGGEPEVLAQNIAEYHGIAIRSGTRITPEVLEKAVNLKVIGRAGTGVDNIDVNAATHKGIVVMNTPGGNTVTTAEHAIAMMLSLARNVPQGTMSLKEGRWDKKALVGAELTGKTLGIAGLGQIGRVVADRAKGLKMRVIASDPFVNPDAAGALGVELVSFDELLQRADFISLHVPRLKETRNMINAAAIKKMKPGVRIINCSRGEVVNLDDLNDALNDGKVAGAALDVFPQEPPGPDLPILHHPKSIFTPHLGASTGEAQDHVAEMIAEQMGNFLVNGIIHHAVNFPSIPKELMDRLQPYLHLGEKMGTLMGQLIHQRHDLTLTYSGEMTKLDTRPLTHAVLKGFLGAFTDTPVNYVNAPTLAEEKGIHIKETMSQGAEDFTATIQLKLHDCTEGPDETWGALFGKKYPRIVRLGKIYMDAIPEGYIIVIQNHDKPGVIGNVGTLLGKHHINIARFQLGRRDGRALCMVNIDTPADESVLQEIMDLPNIISARQVFLG